jgi:hypothetical protein
MLVNQWDIKIFKLGAVLFYVSALTILLQKKNAVLILIRYMSTGLRKKREKSPCYLGNLIFHPNNGREIESVYNKLPRKAI